MFEWIELSKRRPSIRNSKFEIRNSCDGFTLIELLVVVALMAVLATVGSLYYGGYRNENHLKDEGNKVAAVVQNAHDNSVSQLNGAQWGVHFGNGTSSDVYQQFSGPSYASGTPAGAAYGLGYNLAFGDPATSSADIVFNPLTGTLPEDQAVTIVPTPGNGMAENIIVNTLGKITQRFETGLVGYWPLDEGTGTTAYDASGMGNNGTLSSTPPTWQSGSNCEAGGCLYFNGSNNYVSLGTTGLTSVGNFTIGGWTYLTDGTTNNNTLYGGNNVRLLVRPSGIYFGITLGTEYIAQLGTNSNINNWVMWDLVRSGNTMTVYRNAQQIYSGSTLPTSNANISGNLGIQGSYYMKGYIDDVRIYNRALSATEIQDLYNAY